MKEHLIALIRERSARVAVVGLGYVGAPLALAVNQAGFDTVGIDAYLTVLPEELSGLSNMEFDNTFEPVANCDVVLLCVPTPLDENEVPDLSAMMNAVGGVADSFFAGDGKEARPKLVVLESTTYPGTTRELIMPRMQEAGIKPGVDLFLAYAPERIDPGPNMVMVRDITRVIGGYDADAGEVAAEMYSALGCAVHNVSTPDAAEMTKLLENVFRAVNIALVNEMSLLCRRMDINIWEVVEAAATKPFGFMSFKPGPGMGGHCIPVDPFYLAWRARQFSFYPEFVELAGKINRNMPFHVVDWAIEELNRFSKSINGSRVLVIGVAYKEDVADTRESPALKIIEILTGRGADVRYCDPMVPEVNINGNSYTSVSLTPDEIAAADCIVILTAHSSLDRKLLSSAKAPIVDTRNTLGRNGV
ncbi:MAG TPA: nucleotide sugar dehydrogenase [Candidatus Anoxymicrobiaceae bacterium]